ncbi:MAG: ATP-binding protein [Solirubrobacteraceae bacterium]
MSDTRAVCLLGARQAGKSTLVKEIASREHPASYLTLDDDGTRRSALEDPTGFIASISGPAVIDEVQRAPDLMLAIKVRLDTVRDPGQFLLTGSANILMLPTIADALPGRVEYMRLWPFSQGELAGVRERFLDHLFAGKPPHVEGAPVGRQAYAQRIATGGFPDAQSRGARGMSRLFSSYVASILERGVGDVASVRDPTDVSRLLGVAAARSATLMSARSMGSELGVSHKTVAAHTKILEDLFLVRRLRPWHANLGSREVKTPKLYVTDTGLLAHLMNADAERLAHETTLAGAMFETFVAMELERQREWADCEPSLFHYRDGQQREVDIVLELRSGEIAGVEVKSGATVTPRDFTGLRHLRDGLGARFVAGVVLYTGERTLPFGDRLSAVPLCGLWQG